MPYGQAQICVLNEVVPTGNDTLLRFAYRARIECDRRVIPGGLVTVRLRGTWGEARWNASQEWKVLSDSAGPFAKYLDAMERAGEGAYVVGEEGFECPTDRTLQGRARRPLPGQG